MIILNKKMMIIVRILIALRFRKNIGARLYCVYDYFFYKTLITYVIIELIFNYKNTYFILQFQIDFRGICM